MKGNWVNWSNRKYFQGTVCFSLSYLQYMESLESCKNKSVSISVGFDDEDTVEDDEDDDDYFYWVDSQPNCQLRSFWKLLWIFLFKIWTLEPSRNLIYNLFFSPSILRNFTVNFSFMWWTTLRRSTTQVSGLISKILKNKN